MSHPPIDFDPSTIPLTTYASPDELHPLDTLDGDHPLCGTPRPKRSRSGVLPSATWTPTGRVRRPRTRSIWRTR